MKFYPHVVLSALFAAMALICATTITAMDRKKVLEPNSLHVNLPKWVYAPGDTVTNGEIQGFAYRRCDGTHFRFISVDSSGEDHYHTVRALETKESPLGDMRDVVYPSQVSLPIIPFVIPADFSDGHGVVTIVAHFRCNWLGHFFFPIEVVYPPIRFTINSDIPPTALPVPNELRAEP